MFSRTKTITPDYTDGKSHHFRENSIRMGNAITFLTKATRKSDVESPTALTPKTKSVNQNKKPTTPVSVISAARIYIYNTQHPKSSFQSISTPMIYTLKKFHQHKAPQNSPSANKTRQRDLYSNHVTTLEPSARQQAAFSLSSPSYPTLTAA